MEEKKRYRWPCSALTDNEMAFLTKWREKTGTPITELIRQAINICQEVIEKGKHLLLIMALLLFGCSTTHNIAGKIDGDRDKQEQSKATYKIYEKNSLLPSYIIRGNKIYKHGELLPLFTIKNGKIYEAGKPVVPVGEIK